MEIVLIFNPQVTYPELSTLSPELTKQFPSATINEVAMNGVEEATKKMDPSILRIAIILSKNVPPDVYQSILRNLSYVNSQFILYPQTIQPFNIPSNVIASSKSQIFTKIGQHVKKSQKVQNPKSIRMIGIKKSNSQTQQKLIWNTLGFNVFRSKDSQFNKQMNTIFFKYKHNKNIKFNQIKSFDQIPTLAGQKQFLIVSHIDLNYVLGNLPSLDNRTEKVYKILFNTSYKMVNSSELFDLNVNKTSLIRFQIDQFLSKMASAEGISKYNQLGSRSNIVGSKIPSMNNQKAMGSMKSGDLSKLYILDNNNPKFKQMYQDLQSGGEVIYNLQNNQIFNPKTILLAPYQLKNILLNAINNQNMPNIVLYDSSQGKDITDNNLDSKISFVGKSPEEIKAFLKNKVKFNDNKTMAGRTVKFIQDPIPSGTSIDKSLMMNKQINNSSLYLHQWTIKRKPATNKFVTYMSHREQEAMRASESAIGQRSMRKMTSKKKTMVNLVEHQPSIKVIESEHMIDDITSVNKIMNEYNPSPQAVDTKTQRNSNNVNSEIVNKIAGNAYTIFVSPEPPQITQYYSNNTKTSSPVPTSPKPLGLSSRIIQDEYDETVISIKNSKIKSKISDSNVVQNKINSTIVQEFKPQPMSPGISNISSNIKQSSIKSLSLNQNSVLNQTSNFGYSPPSFMTSPSPSSLNSKIQKNMQLNKNIQIAIKPSPGKNVKQDKQVIQIMTTKPASTIISSQPSQSLQPSQSTYNQTIPRKQQKVTRSVSIDPSFIDPKYQRVVENGITKYIIKQQYKDQMIKKILHERDPLNQPYNYARQRLYSTQKTERPQYSYNQYYGNQRIGLINQPSYPLTQRTNILNRVKSVPSEYKQNYSPSPSYNYQKTNYNVITSPTPFSTMNSPKLKNILYVVPNSRQTLIDRVKHIITKNDTILPYNNQQQLRSFQFDSYNTVILFPRDQNKQSLLTKIASNCYSIKLNRQSRLFNNKQLFVNDIKQLPNLCHQLSQSKQSASSYILPNLHSNISSNTSYNTYNKTINNHIAIIPSQISSIKNILNTKYELYNSTQQLYDILQSYKNNKLMVIIDKQLEQFIQDFEMPSTTQFVVYDKRYKNQNKIVEEIRALELGYGY